MGSQTGFRKWQNHIYQGLTKNHKDTGRLEGKRWYYKQINANIFETLSEIEKSPQSTTYKKGVGITTNWISTEMNL